MPRSYQLADILSVTTGRLLSRDHMGGIYNILNGLTGDNLFTHQLPRAVDACRPSVIAQHPQLDGIEPPEDIDVADLMAWLLDAERQFGEELPVEPLAPEAWEQRNPIEELCDMVGAERVVVATIPPYDLPGDVRAGGGGEQ
jgi:hypothetical protein